jgi:hypothetical protein
LVATIRLATRFNPSASATEEPPNFCTIKPLGVSVEHRWEKLGIISNNKTLMYLII